MIHRKLLIATAIKPPTPKLRCRARLSFPPPGHRIA